MHILHPVNKAITTPDGDSDNERYDEKNRTCAQPSLLVKLPVQIYVTYTSKTIYRFVHIQVQQLISTAAISVLLVRVIFLDVGLCQQD